VQLALGQPAPPQPADRPRPEAGTLHQGHPQREPAAVAPGRGRGRRGVLDARRDLGQLGGRTRQQVGAAAQPFLDRACREGGESPPPQPAGNGRFGWHRPAGARRGAVRRNPGGLRPGAWVSWCGSLVEDGNRHRQFRRCDGDGRYGGRKPEPRDRPRANRTPHRPPWEPTGTKKRRSGRGCALVTPGKAGGS
jgi:hypothetical protein